MLFITLAWCTITGAVKPDDIFWAAQHNNTKLAQQCIDTHGVKVLGKRGFQNSTPLHYAAYNNSTEITQLILKKGSPKLLKVKDNDGNTPLHIAAFWNAQETVQLLLDSNANIQAINDKGKTPASTWSDKIKELLIQQQLKLNRQLLEGIANNNIEKVKSNLKLGAKINARAEGKENNGWTPLHIAVRHNNPELVTFLLGYGADPTIYDTNGETPVHIATSDKEIMQTFVKAAYAKKQSRCTIM